MPGMSGKELSDQARKIKPNLKVLYTSGYTRNAIVHGGRLDPGVALLAKPFTSRALAERVRELLDTGSGMRLLIVESDPTVRLLTIEALTTAGYHPEPAATAAEALNKLRAAQGRYEAVIIDADLEDKDWRALLEEVRGLFSHLPVLITGSEAAAPDGMGPTAAIAKPFSATMIIDALGSLAFPSRD
jgi:DNA-binding response OmpR family regulator